jgi:nitrogen fixation protein NifU and related proteins
MDDIYREYILDLYRNPLNKGELAESTHKQHGFNPNCGDDIWVYLNIQDGIIVGASFDGVGCALCIAGASIITDKLRGLSLTEISTISAEQVYQWLGIEMENTRIKCVTLALRTAQEMIV